MDPLQLLLQKALDAVVVMRRDGSVADWNDCAEATFGWTREEALGCTMSDLIVPPQHRQAHGRGLQRYLETGIGTVIGRRIEISAIDRSGREFPVELSITELAYEGDTAFIGFLRDISDRKAAEIALRDSEARLAATYNHALVGIAEVDRRGGILRTNEQFALIVGHEPQDLESRTVFDITHPDDVELDRALFDEQWSGQRDAYRLEKRFIRQDGGIVWVDLAASIVRGEGGASTYGVRIVRDISDRKRADEHQRLLISELNHRVKNTLAVVQGLAYQTFKPELVPPDLVAAFEGRLFALAAAHDLIVRETWDSTQIDDLIREALRPFEESPPRFTISGPPVLLTPAATVGLALGLHELATNAAKYGALSRPQGRVAIDWGVEDGELRLHWRESGGPRVVKPRRKGFGTRLLERALASDLGGSVDLDFQPSGLLCRMRGPLARISPAD